MPQSFISTALADLRQAQAEFQQALQPGKVLLVDSTFGGVAKQVREGIPSLKTSQASPEVLSYLEDLEGLNVPQEAKDIYAQFFGPALSFQTHSIQTQTVPDLSSVSLVILSGSPANVTHGVKAGEIEIALGTTHQEVLRRESSIIQSVLSQNIPMIGLCYGHQSLSHVLDGTVGRLPGPIFGTCLAQLTQKGGDQFTQWNLDPNSFLFPVPAYHQDVVATVPTHSTSLLEAITPYGTLNYGTVHGSSAISVQYHPEYLFIEPLLTAVRTQQPLQQPTSVASSIETLRLFTKFLQSRRVA